MLSVFQLSQETGITIQGIHAAIRDGRLTKTNKQVDETSQQTKDFIQGALMASARRKEDHKKTSESKISTKQDLEMQRLVQQVKQLELRNEEKEGDLISKKFVKQFIFDQVSTAHQRILIDGVKSLAALIHPAVLGGATIEEIEATMRKNLSSFLKACNKQMVKVVKGCNDSEIKIKGPDVEPAAD